MVVTADSDIAAMEDLKDKMIGTHLGTTGDFLVSDEISEGVLAGSSAQNNQYKALPDAAEELKSGTLQGIVCDSVLAENLVKANGDALKCFPVVYADGTSPDEENIGAAMAKGDEEFTAKINEIVQKLKSDGKIDEWFVKHSEEASKL
jgi:polar amino acid transport system substrate-binding protein